MVFLRPAIMHLLGQQAAALQDEIISARTSVPLPVNDQRQDYVRATIGNVDGDLPRVIPAFKQDSSMIKVLANASALIIRPPFDPAKQAGDIVQIMKIPPLL
jgi:molybdopterin molybdotransferase